MFEVRLTLAASDVRHVLVLGRSGNIKHVSNTLAHSFGLNERSGGNLPVAGPPGAGAEEAAAAVGSNLQDLLPVWWRELGGKYLQVGKPPGWLCWLVGCHAHPKGTLHCWGVCTGCPNVCVGEAGFWSGLAAGAAYCSPSLPWPAAAYPCPGLVHGHVA